VDRIPVGAEEVAQPLEPERRPRALCRGDGDAGEDGEDRQPAGERQDAERPVDAGPGAAMDAEVRRLLAGEWFRCDCRHGGPCYWKSDALAHRSVCQCTGIAAVGISWPEPPAG